MKTRAMWKACSTKRSGSSFEITENRVRPSFYPIREIVKSSFKTIERLYEKKELVTGVPSGFKELDQNDRRLSAL